MKKNTFLLLIAVFTFFISACAEDEEEIVAGSSCYSEGLEICSDNGIELLLCQNSTWTLKKQCNISIGKRCRQNADGVFGCFGEGETDVSDSGTNPDDTDTDSGNSENNTEEPDTNDTSDTENETPDDDAASGDPNDKDDSDDKQHTDTEPSDPDNSEDTEFTDNDTENVPVENDNDLDIPEPPAGQCSSNSDCSGSTPYCSISTSQCIANAVFITEYVEGSGDNKAIEIYNGSKSSVNLGNFTIQQSNNGKDWGSDANFIYSFTDSTAIPSGGIFVFCNAAADTELIAKCDKSVTTSIFKFNGDDGMALFDGTSIVDQVGNQDYVKWSVAGVAKATENHTLRRKPEIIQGTTDWAASAGTTESDSQWIVLDLDTFDGLGQR